MATESQSGRGLRFAGLCLAGFVVLALAGCAASVPSIESDIMDGEWSAVLRQLSGNEAGAALPLLKAHALLALNRGDEAVCSFYGVSDTQRKTWDAWTRDVMRRHPNASVAHYLHGDALARTSDFGGAEREFGHALELDSRNVMALNARGVVRALRHDWNGIDDLRNATGHKPKFGAAWTSLGYADLASGHSADGAMDAFDAALKLEPKSSLAMAGRGYSVLASGNWAESEDWIRKSANNATGCIAPLLARNLTLTAGWVARAARTEPRTGEEAPGTEMSHELQSLTDQHDLSALGAIGHDLGMHPELKSMYDNAIGSIQKNDPSFYSQIVGRLQTNASWDQPGGGAYAILNTLKGISADLSFKAGLDSGKTDLGAKAGLSYSVAPLMDGLLKQTQKDYSGYKLMMNDLNLPKPSGGANTSLVNAHLDDGDWPSFVPLYSLGYPVEEDRQ